MANDTPTGVNTDTENTPPTVTEPAGHTKPRYTYSLFPPVQVHRAPSFRGLFGHGGIQGPTDSKRALSNPTSEAKSSGVTEQRRSISESYEADVEDNTHSIPKKESSPTPSAVPKAQIPTTFALPFRPKPTRIPFKVDGGAWNVDGSVPHDANKIGAGKGGSGQGSSHTLSKKIVRWSDHLVCMVIFCLASCLRQIANTRL